MNINTSIPKENWGVHITHCCKTHGCKYGYNDCPVVLGLVEQEYKCEFGDWESPCLPEEKRSGFFPLEKVENCNNPEHNPPTHLVIPQGKGYRHICPGCKKETLIIPPQITY